MHQLVDLLQRREPSPLKQWMKAGIIASRLNIPAPVICNEAEQRSGRNAARPALEFSIENGKPVFAEGVLESLQMYPRNQLDCTARVILRLASRRPDLIDDLIVWGADLAS